MNINFIVINSLHIKYYHMVKYSHTKEGEIYMKETKIIQKIALIVCVIIVIAFIIMSFRGVLF